MINLGNPLDDEDMEDDLMRKDVQMRCFDLTATEASLLCPSVMNIYSDPECRFSSSKKIAGLLIKPEIPTPRIRTRSNMMTRKEKEEAKRKDHILATAEALFAEKGLQHTSVADIAHAAEFGVGTLYRYFQDKDTLIASLLEARITEHFDTIEAALDNESSPPELIDHFIEAFLKSVSRRKAFFKIYFTCFHPATDNTALSPKLELLEKRKWELFARVDDIYRKGIEKGYFLNVGDESYLTATTWGILMSFYFLAQIRYNGAINIVKMKEAIQRLLFEKVRLSA